MGPYTFLDAKIEINYFNFVEKLIFLHWVLPTTCPLGKPCGSRCTNCHLFVVLELLPRKIFVANWSDSKTTHYFGFMFGTMGSPNNRVCNALLLGEQARWIEVAAQCLVGTRVPVHEHALQLVPPCQPSPIGLHLRARWRITSAQSTWLQTLRTCTRYKRPTLQLSALSTFSSRAHS